MITEDIEYPKYYPGMKTIVYAPEYYFPENVKKDWYSCKIVFSKSETQFVAMFAKKLRELLEELKAKNILTGVALVTIMPSHSKDTYSATLMELGPELSKNLNVPFKRILNRVRYSDSKSTDISTLEERYAFEKDSMSVVENSVVKDKKILLLDDVKTTGIAIMEAIKMLLAAGAREVLPICLGINNDFDIESWGGG